MGNIRAYTLNNSKDKAIISVEREDNLYNFFEVSIDDCDSKGDLTISPIDNIFDYVSSGLQYNEKLTSYFEKNEGMKRSNGKRK